MPEDAGSRKRRGIVANTLQTRYTFTRVLEVGYQHHTCWRHPCLGLEIPVRSAVFDVDLPHLPSERVRRQSCGGNAPFSRT